MLAIISILSNSIPRPICVDSSAVVYCWYLFCSDVMTGLTDQLIGCQNVGNKVKYGK
jgi:hypothetical protein